MTLKNKKILIIIGGGIAAYKSLDLIRLLRKDNVLNGEFPGLDKLGVEATDMKKELAKIYKK